MAQPGDYFDAATHRYYIGHREVPGVTGILKAAGIIDTTFLRNEAALLKGRQVHLACEGMDALRAASDDRTGAQAALAICNEMGATRRIGGCVLAYAQFCRDHAPRYTHIERGLLHPTLRFGGRSDRICADLCGQGPAILEIKTGSPASWHGVQLAGYQLLFPTGARWVVYLRDDGRYNLKRCTNAGDYGTFMQALADYHDSRREAATP